MTCAICVRSTAIMKWVARGRWSLRTLGEQINVARGEVPGQARQQGCNINGNPEGTKGVDGVKRGIQGRTKVTADLGHG